MVSLRTRARLPRASTGGKVVASVSRVPIDSREKGGPLKKRIKAEHKKEADIDNANQPQYFLMKAEPESRIENGIDVKFSIDDLQKVESEPWDGVRNAEATKTMRDRMKIGDQAFFYHSNTKNPGIAGIATICREGYPDSSAWEPTHPYFDPKTDKDRPKWYRVDVKYKRHLDRFVSLRELKQGKFPELENMQLLRRPQLSVQRLTAIEWETILRIEGQSPEEETRKGGKLSEIASGIETDEESVRASQRARDEDIKAEIIATHGGPST